MAKEVDIVVIGAGPVGLFTVFEAGLLGLNCVLIDNLDKPGGQCAELYPEKPIYDIPGVPFQTAQEHVDALLKQIEPFNYELVLNERVELINEIDHEDSKFWEIETNESTKFITKNIFIAAGAGSFEPRRPANISEPDKFLNKGVTYAVRSKSLYENKDIFIFGGGDSALDWTIDLAEKAKSLSLVHRRDVFRGALHSEEKMRELVASGKVKLLTPYLIDGIEGSDKVQGVTLKNFDTNEIEHHSADELLFLFGLNKKLGPILEWNLDLSGKKISVNTENYQTSVEGIFAVGDINDYPGKLDLILSGFHETTLAVQEAYKRIYPGERVPFGYTTSNSKLQEKLGVKEKIKLELINLIHKELPQIQCGRCDTPGCMQYAQAIVDGNPHDRCVPGGQETLNKLNQLLDKKISKVNLDYGPTINSQKVTIVEDECIGCKKCIDACPVDAIVGSANMMHSIIDDICTGCELCIEPCPVDCIEIVSVPEDQIKQQRDSSQFFYNLKETTNTKKRSKLKNFSNENLNISKFINNQIENRGINKSENLNNMQVNITKNDLQNLHKFDESLLENFVKNKSD